MARSDSVNHNDFSEYQNFIVSHVNYKSLPNKTNSMGEITWVSVKDGPRAQWWDELKVNLNHKDRASVARAIHPAELGGYKPCQVCGRKMRILAVYPNLRATKKIAFEFPHLKIAHFELEISEIASKVEKAYGATGLKRLGGIFNYSGKISDAASLASGIIELGKGLSPGVMSNAPDRLDGFHTYNACCRATQDTGRHASNLSRYSTDRRAYENWADGNWRGADRLMGKYQSSTETVACPRCGIISKMSADHIGPISLGFMHRMDFRPLCVPCNSNKNNRMSFQDIKTLIAVEKKGEEVISWHSKALWNKLRENIKSDEQALAASKLLRKNMHYVMCILASLQEAGFEDFLETYLHPEFAAFDYNFTLFEIATGKFKAEQFPVDSLNTRKQAKRYVRISFESLREYSEKENRNSTRWVDKEVDGMLKEVEMLLKSSLYVTAKQLINKMLERLATALITNF
jgi:Alw26I/Eco31I/Esp3I family type II restriction endonuclease